MCVLNLQTLYIRNLHDVLLLVLTENLPSDQINFLINYFFFAFFCEPMVCVSAGARKPALN